MRTQLARLLGLKPARFSETANSRRFSEVYDHGLWGSPESVSGPGSERGSGQVEHSIKILDRFTRELGLRSIADIPCGDFNWMPQFLERHPGLRYVGYDVVPHLISTNRERHPGVQFRWLDITQGKPAKADLIFCKDLLNHLSEADVWKALENMVASGAKYLLLTTNRGFDNVDLSPELPHASRHLNLEAAPYALSGPIYGDHYLLLFRATDVARRLRERVRTAA